LHHTKCKADIGLSKVITDLMRKGFVPCIPLSEHQPYDLIAVAYSGTTFRIQVKYAALKQNGTIEVRFRRNWADGNGCHTQAYAKDEFDYYAIFCPEKDKVVYIPNGPDCPKVIRFDRTANNQAQYIKWANEYLEIKQESSETIRRTPAMAKT